MLGTVPLLRDVKFAASRYKNRPVQVNIPLLSAATDMALSEYLLEQVGVAVVPGSAFGAEGYFRISFATSMDNLTKALDRIEQALL
jgi:aspartate/methionine/tyrosine aminotransferase